MNPMVGHDPAASALAIVRCPLRLQSSRDAAMPRNPSNTHDTCGCKAVTALTPHNPRGCDKQGALLRLRSIESPAVDDAALVLSIGM